MKQLLILFLGILSLTNCEKDVSNHNYIRKSKSSKKTNTLTSKIQDDTLTNSENLNSIIRFDGLYQEVDDSLNNLDADYSKYPYVKHYIRFFQNGQVMTATSSGTPNDLKKWFNRKCKNCSVGQFEITGQTIHFEVVSKNGKVIYDGIVDETHELKLNTKSLINYNQSNYKLRFIKINWTE